MFPVGLKLAQWRARKGVTQVDLSKRSGIPQANLSKIERGQQDPTVTTFLKICSALSVPPTEIFKEEAKRNLPRFTRKGIEKIARAVLEPSLKLPTGEREIAELLRDLVPGLQKRRPSARRIYHAWYELRRRLSSDAIKILMERIRDARMRLDASKPD